MPLKQVDQSPVIPGLPTTARAAIESILRDHGFTINQLIPKVVLTANLPAANPELVGFIIEDGGAGNRNLILYVGGQRFRIDGGAPF